MAKRRYTNRLNDLEPKEWLKFQKSWFIHTPPPRKQEVIRHPAKFPETLAQEFIEFFTKEDQIVLDPMVGTGSTLVAALRAKRHSYGIELNPEYAAITSQLVNEERALLGHESNRYQTEVIAADTASFSTLVEEYELPKFDYVFTSPPYWDMLHAKGAQAQKKRRNTSDLDVVYSDNPDDLGNEHDYEKFINRLEKIYTSLAPAIRAGAYLTIVVKNVKKGGKIYPIAWDLARRLGQTYSLKDERIWCQDNQRLAPYGLGSAWVSNTFHHYCLQFRNE